MLLLDAGAEVNAVDRSHGGSALHSAAQAGHAELCAKLLDRGAEVHGADNSGRAAVHHAASGGHAEVCAVLLDWGAELDSATALICEQATSCGSSLPGSAEKTAAPFSKQEARLNAFLGEVASSAKPPTSPRAAARHLAVLVEPKPLEDRPPELDTDLDELECDRISQIVNRNPSPGYVFPPEV